MEKRKQQLKLFFYRYADLFNRALGGHVDAEATAHSFSSCFIAANPSGVFCGNNDAQFRTNLLQGYAFYQGIGVGAMDIQYLETTLLDAFHEMTKVGWRCRFTREDRSVGDIEFENIYFTQTISGEPKIFAYITGDEQAVLKQYGLVPQD